MLRSIDIGDPDPEILELSNFSWGHLRSILMNLV